MTGSLRGPSAPAGPTARLLSPLVRLPRDGVALQPPAVRPVSGPARQPPRMREIHALTVARDGACRGVRASGSERVSRANRGNSPRILPARAAPW
jgi:hypothetical protein